MFKRTIRILICAIIMTPSLLWAKDQCSKFGALVLAHGSHKDGHHHIFSDSEHDHWNETVIAAVEEVKRRVDFPLELAFGMWDQESFQTGVDKLANQGICALKVVPLFISSDSEMIDIQKYMFGVSENPNFPIPVGRLKIPLQIESVQYQKALDTHEYVSEILTDRIKELSVEPEAEGIILLAHGPYTDFYEPRWFELLQVHAERIQKNVTETQGKQFKDISFFTLRDDSPEKTRNERTRQIRTKVSQLNEMHIKPIVVPVILSAGGIEEGIFQRLEGLDYQITKQYLMPHKKIVDWIEYRSKE